MNAVSATRRQYRELPDGTLEVKIHIDPPYKRAFLELFPDMDMPAAIAPLVADFEQKEKQQKEPNKLAEKLHRDGYFRNSKLWTAMERAGIYTQAEHKAYVEQKPCCASFVVLATNRCFGDVVAHHVTSADLPAAGKTTDNPRKVSHWYTAPLCAIAHHQNLAHTNLGREQRKELQRYAIELTAGRMKAKIKEHLCIGSLSEITQEMLDQFEREIGL